VRDHKLDRVHFCRICDDLEMAIGKGVWVKLPEFGSSDGTFFMHVFYVFWCAEFKKSKIKTIIRRESIDNQKKLKKN